MKTEMKMKIAHEVTFELKDYFKSIVPSARWDKNNKVWTYKEGDPQYVVWQEKLNELNAAAQTAREARRQQEMVEYAAAHNISVEQVEAHKALQAQIAVDKLREVREKAEAHKAAIRAKREANYGDIMRVFSNVASEMRFLLSVLQSPGKYTFSTKNRGRLDDAQSNIRDEAERIGIRDTNLEQLLGASYNRVVSGKDDYRQRAFDFLDEWNIIC